jgi:hypothetical protein
MDHRISWSCAIVETPARCHVCMYVCMHVCMYVCMYVYTYIYIYILCVCVYLNVDRAIVDTYLWDKLFMTART